MMSYLWILLLGSLLATSAQAQDDEAPTEEAAAPEAPAPEADTAAEVKVDSTADKETGHTAEEVPPTTASEPDNEAGEPVTPAVVKAEPAATPAADTAPEAEAEAKADAEAATTTAAPAADLEVIDPTAEEPIALGDTSGDTSEATSSTGATPAQEESGPEATSAAGPAVADNEEKAIVPTADAQPAKPAVEEKVQPEVEVLVPEIKMEDVPELNTGFDLEDALSDDNAVEGPGEKSSFESGPHAAGASGEADKPEVQEAGSGSLAAILSAIAVSVVGAVVGYYTYQKKKLCFKNREEADPEAARKAVATEAQADPHVLSNLLNSS